MEGMEAYLEDEYKSKDAGENFGYEHDAFYEEVTAGTVGGISDNKMYAGKISGPKFRI